MADQDKPINITSDYFPLFPNARSPKWVFWYQVLSFGWYQLYWFFRNLRHFHAHKNFKPDSFNYFLMLPIWVFGWPFLFNLQISRPIVISRSTDFTFVLFLTLFMGLIFTVGFAWLYYRQFEIIKSYLKVQGEADNQFPKNFALMMGLAFLLEYYLSFSFAFSLIYLVGPVIMGFVMMRVQRMLNQIWEDHVDIALEGHVATRLPVLDRVIIFFIAVIPVFYWIVVLFLTSIDLGILDLLPDEEIIME